MGSSFLVLSILFLSMVPLLVSSTEFKVGGELGWVEPTKNNSDMYNEWAGHHRFHVGDMIYFKYKKDSVLVVNKEDYENCVDTNPISKFADGHTIFEFEHFGYYYFISGQPGHCKSGQKMVIRVMARSDGGDETPKSSPGPKSDGGDEAGHHEWDDFGPPGFNATTRLSVAYCFTTALVGIFVVLYYFM